MLIKQVEIFIQGENFMEFETRKEINCTFKPKFTAEQRKKICNKIHSLIEDKKMDVEEVQAMLQYDTPQAVYKIYRGEGLPTFDNILRLSVNLDVEIEEILCCKEACLGYF